MEVDGGLVTLSEGGGKLSGGMGGIALFIPPVNAFRVGVALGF